MNILSEEQHRLLGFIAACNGSSYNPTAREVMLWWQNPEPTKAEYRTVEVPPIGAGFAGLAGLNPQGSFARLAGFNQSSPAIQRMLETIGSNQFRGVMDGINAMMFKGTTRRELVKEAETVIDHLIRLTWLEKVTESGMSGLRLSKLGRALLHDHERESAAREDVSVVVFEVEDPLAYPLLVGQLANAGDGLLIDPYLKLDDLHRIVVSTSLTRLLVTGVPQNAREVAAMQTYLDSPSLGRRVEVRSSMQLHDRVLIAADGSVLTLGTSLNGVGRKLTVLSPIPRNQCDVFHETYEQIWDSATIVGPLPDDNESDEGVGDEINDGEEAGDEANDGEEAGTGETDEDTEVKADTDEGEEVDTDTDDGD